MKKDQISLWELFVAFMKIGVMTFGGGYAMLPMLQREIVEKHKWATEEEIMDYFAVGQCTPGVIAVNTATFVGYKSRGILGGAIATVGVVLPSVVIIILIAAVLQNFAENPYVRHAFAGINIAVAALIIQAVVKLGKSSITDWLCVGIALCAFVVTGVLGLSPIYMVVASAVAGIFSVRIKDKRRAGKEEK